MGKQCQLKHLSSVAWNEINRDSISSGERTWKKALKVHKSLVKHWSAGHAGRTVQISTHHRGLNPVALGCMDFLE